MRKTIYEDCYRDVMTGLRDARRRRQLRQEDVARELGVTRTWISKTERCEIRLDALQLVRLAGVYSIDARELVDALMGRPDTSGPDRSPGKRPSGAGLKFALKTRNNSLHPA